LNNDNPFGVALHGPLAADTENHLVSNKAVCLEIDFVAALSNCLVLLP
jgi:hypothetical protein